MDPKTTQPTPDDLVYGTSHWQKTLYNIERDEQPHLAAMEQKGADRAPRFADFQRELFARFYNPRTPKLDQPAEGAEWAEKLHEAAEQVAEFKVLQDRTSGDEMWSGMATASVGKSIVATMQPQQQDDGNGQHDYEEAQRRVDSLKDLQDKGVNVGKRLAKAERQLERAKERAEAMAKGLDPSALRKAIRAACEKAQDDISDAQQAINAFSYGDQPGTPVSKGNMQDKRRLAQQLNDNPKLKAIAKAAGRMRVTAAEKQRSKCNYARDEVTSVEQGADVERLLPNEWALLASDDEYLEMVGLARIVERKAMQYKLTGREKEGRGPIVFLMDESSSMDGEPEVFSKACAMAMLDVAQRQKRSWHFVHFSRQVTRIDTVHAGKVDSAALMECMDHFSRGGTSFEEPLRKAIDLIKEGGDFKKADIVLVTDGECETGAEFNKWFAEQVDECEASVFTVLVNSVAAGDAVAQWSDHIYALEDILEGGEKGSFEDAVFSV